MRLLCRRMKLNVFSKCWREWVAHRLVKPREVLLDQRRSAYRLLYLQATVLDSLDHPTDLQEPPTLLDLLSQTLLPPQGKVFSPSFEHGKIVVEHSWNKNGRREKGNERRRKNGIEEGMNEGGNWND